jgi:hypothetical protein
MTPLIAHAGHWMTTVAYFLPVVTQIRERRGRGGLGDEDRGDPSD